MQDHILKDPQLRDERFTAAEIEAIADMIFGLREAPRRYLLEALEPQGRRRLQRLLLEIIQKRIN